MGKRTWTIHELLKVTTDYLKGKEIESPRLNAEILLAHQLGTSRIALYLEFDRPLIDEEIAGYRTLIRRRVKREPVQYITGVQEFWSMGFFVGPEALIPRPESELLVEQLLFLYRDQRIPGGSNPRFLELGTGCGAIAVALSREVDGASIRASDISEEALNLARVNAGRQGVEERIAFRAGDLLRPFEEEGLLFDAIVSNPPYIATDAIPSLAPEVRDYEPRLALDGGKEGMAHIEKIIKGAPLCLEPGGWLLLEMDPEQTSKALALIEADPRYGERARVKDYSQRYRVVMARKR
jgi:release factor glutamine methyltransferase